MRQNRLLNLNAKNAASVMLALSLVFALRCADATEPYGQRTRHHREPAAADGI
jgi:hypothetical protein